MRKKHYFRTFFFILILIITLIIIYGLFLGNKGLIIKEYNIPNKNIPESLNNLKIAHFSDIMYSKKEDISLLDNLDTKINDKKPDIIIFTGNLTKNKYTFNEKEIEKITNKLSKLNST